MYDYNAIDHNPPAPVCKARIIAPAEPILNIPEVGIELLMLLDTGADCGCLPPNVIQELERQRGAKLPYTQQLYIGVDGSSHVCDGYELGIEAEELGGRWTIEFAVPPTEVALLGRDLLNQISILHDGPALKWKVF